jgi:hypothetical protein
LARELTAVTRRCEFRGIATTEKRISKEIIGQAGNLKGNTFVGAALHPATQCIQRLIRRLQLFFLGGNNLF